MEQHDDVVFQRTHTMINGDYFCSWDFIQAGLEIASDEFLDDRDQLENYDLIREVTQDLYRRLKLVSFHIHALGCSNSLLRELLPEPDM
jgi:hypothetical protein